MAMATGTRNGQAMAMASGRNELSSYLLINLSLVCGALWLVHVCGTVSHWQLC